MTVTTVYSLFGDDVRQIAFEITAGIFAKFNSIDDTFNYLNCIALALFGIEIIIASIVKEDYFNGFYFWLDFISTVSMITDIGWIMQGIMGTGGSVSNARQAARVARAGRGARIGTRAGRIARVIRLIRLIRIVKLYKSANNALGDNEDKDQLQLELAEAKKLQMLEKKRKQAQQSNGPQ